VEGKRKGKGKRNRKRKRKRKRTRKGKRKRKREKEKERKRPPKSQLACALKSQDALEWPPEFSLQLKPHVMVEASGLACLPPFTGLPAQKS